MLSDSILMINKRLDLIEKKSTDKNVSHQVDQIRQLLDELFTPSDQLGCCLCETQLYPRPPDLHIFESS
jgi:hypothetical protein